MRRRKLRPDERRVVNAARRMDIVWNRFGAWATRLCPAELVCPDRATFDLDHPTCRTTMANRLDQLDEEALRYSLVLHRFMND